MIVLRYGWRVRYWVRRKREALQRAIVWRAPRWMVKWCFYRVVADATTGKFGHTNVQELTAMDAIKRWEER